MSGVRITTLDNGLRIISEARDSVQSVSLGIWIGAGTRNERAEDNGVAHMLEHMVFKGTGRRSAQAIAEEIEDVGGIMNAYTGREQTGYYAKVLKDDIDLAIDLVSDIVIDATLDEDELVRERTVVLQEIGQANDTPDDVIHDHFQATAYPGQSLGRPVLGEPEIVAAMDRDTVDRFRGENYTAHGMVFAAAGRLDHDHLVDEVARRCGALPSGNGRLPLEPARYEGGEFRDDRALEQVHILLGLEGVASRSDDIYPLSVFATLLGGGMSSRLFQELREKRGLVYAIQSYAQPYRDSGLFSIYAGTGPEDAGECLRVIAEVMAGVDQDLTEAEVARARAQLKASILMSLESTSGRCEQLAQQLIIYGEPLSLDDMVAKIDAVDCDAVAAMAARLRAMPPTLAQLGPLGQAIDRDDLIARLN